jgi:hypothetical protein
MLRAFTLALLAVLSNGCGSDKLTGPADPSLAPESIVTHSRTVQVFPLAAPLINTCFNGGVGESIRLFGSIVLTTQRVSQSSGKSVEVLHVRTEGVHGVGLTSGIRYQVIEHQNTVTQIRADGTSVMFVFTIRVIGAGRVENEVGASRFRLIIAADGTRTLVFEELDHTCR